MSRILIAREANREPLRFLMESYDEPHEGGAREFVFALRERADPPESP